MTVAAQSVWFAEGRLWIDLSDGRTLGVPLAWFPRLRDATPEARSAVTISASGLHWEALDEDISLDGLVAGRRDQTLDFRMRCTAAPEG